MKALSELYLDHNYLDVTSIPMEVQKLPNRTDFRFGDQSKKFNYTILIIIIIIAIILLSIIIASIILFRKKKNGKSDKNENDKINILIKQNDSELQEQKSQIEVNTMNLKQQIESQEQEIQQKIYQQQQKLQQLQKIKQHLERFDKSSSLSLSTDSVSVKKTKVQEALEEKLLQQQQQQLDPSFSFGHNTTPINGIHPSHNLSSSKYSMILNESILPVASSSTTTYDNDTPPNYEEIIKEIEKLSSPDNE